MKWRIVNEGRYSEAMHHALDEVLTEKMDKGLMNPTLRFWYRKNPSVPMGRFQAYQDEVEQEYVEDNSIEVVRRITGGGAMFSEPGNVITYSIYAPHEIVNDDIEKSYEELDNFAVTALNSLGIKAEYKPLNDIEHPDGKLGGAAQLRKKNAVLHHTMISYDLNIENMLKALRIGDEKVSDKAIKSAEKRVTRISDYTSCSRSKVIEAMIQNFVKDKEWENRALTSEEVEKASDLAGQKFSSDKWNKKL